MAELIAGAFLSSVFQATFERLASRDFRGCFNERLVEKLEIVLNSINQLLDDAETKQYQNIYVKNWLDKLKHEVYEVEQLLDEISLYTEQKGKVQRFFSGFTNTFEARIKDLLDKLKLLIEQKDMLGLNQRNSTSNEGGVSVQSSKRSPSASLVDESSIYGREHEKEEIINFLLSENGSSNRETIISIVGLGGMGKTTLAQLVYNDQRMEKQFELKAWVHVSEYFDVVGLTKTILRSFGSSADSTEDLDPLVYKLQQTLTNKKCLLVLDDVWNGNEGCWDQLLLPFNCGSSGSKIIVTTRNKEVALVMKSDQQLHLKKLEGSDCWSLFVNHAFHGINVLEYPNLEMIGKKIVDKCGGLPLAVKTLGNLLRRKFSPGEWVKVLETDLCLLSNDDSNINPTLRLSYHCLPSNLKRCFVYCSIFPKGYEFEKEELIELWRAEGLLKCTTEKSEEEFGNQFFNDLQSISFFEQSRSFGKFVLHDLVSDLANSISGELFFVMKGDRVQDIPKRTRHIWCSLGLKHRDINLENIYKIKGLRSLALPTHHYARRHFKHEICKNVQQDLFSRLKYLRMLSFFGCNISKLADEISNLKLLRYLNLSYTGLPNLPDSICMLYNLQTLLLKCCNLTELPSNFSKLVNLRHLNLEGNYITKAPKHIGRLHHLQTLTTLDFVVEKTSGLDIKEVAKLNHLQGRLCISSLENVIDPSNAAEANLKDKKHLEELCMKYSTSHDKGVNNGGTLKFERDVSVLEALQPNNNLKRLTIEEYTGNSFPNWIRGCDLPNLVSIKLKRCELCSQLPPLGQLSSLKEISISGCDGIGIIGEEFYGNNTATVPFRSLEILRFDSMSEWEEWLCIEGFPFLKELSIKNCPKLKKALPQHLPSLQKLTVIDCKVLESSIPKASNISELDIKGCDIILINELPFTLKKLVLRENRITKVSLDHIFNNVVLEELDLDFSGFEEYPYLDLCCYNTLRTLSLEGWCSAYLPFDLHLFTDLDSLKLSHCPKLKMFRGGGLPSNLDRLEIINCPKLIASIERWGLFQLKYLKEFKVSDDFENNETFPEAHLLPRTIHILHLYKCSKLRIMNAYGLLHIGSLQSMYIQSCPLLERLPEGLHKFTFLGIDDCPLLKEKYQKDGECWHTISHISHVEIDGIEQQK